MNPGATNTIFNHFNEFFDQKFGLPKKKYKITITLNGDHSSHEVEANSFKEAESMLRVWLPGDWQMLGFKEL